MIKPEDLQIVATCHVPEEFRESGMHTFVMAHALKPGETVQGLAHRLLVYNANAEYHHTHTDGYIELRIMVQPKEQK